MGKINFFAKVALVVTMIIGLSGCMGGKKEPVKYPQWYYSVPADTGLHLYGVGEGTSKKEAVSIALSTIASKVNVSIESSFSASTSTSSYNGKASSYSKSTRKNVKNSVKKIEFSNYKVRENKKLSNNKIIVLVIVNKLDNAQIMTEKIDTQIKTISSDLTKDYNNAIAKLRHFNVLSKKIETKLIPDCFIIKSLDNSSEIEQRITKLNNLKVKLDNYISKITVSITIDGKNSKDYSNVLLENISAKGFSTTRNSQEADLNIKLSSNNGKAKAVGNYIYKSKIELTIVSKGKIIGKEMIAIGGKSRANYSQAKSFAVTNFDKKIRKEKILEKLMGI